MLTAGDATSPYVATALRRLDPNEEYCCQATVFEV
jgi:hypothetical protein